MPSESPIVKLHNMNHYRSIFRIIFTYSVILITIGLTKYSNYLLYPLAVLIIGNQAFTLTLFGHEATHFLICKNRKLNTFIGRYLCHFPNFSSHSFYSNMHLNHHRFLGSSRDPDIPIYQLQYKSIGVWCLKSLKEMLRGKLIFDFLNYFNGFYIFLKHSEIYPKIKTDYRALLVFWILIFTLFWHFNHFQDFIIFWIIPLLFSLPWIKLINSYHHYHEGGPLLDFSRNIKIENPLLRELLFPLNSTYHGMHHIHPNIPYYSLPLLEKINWTQFNEANQIIFCKHNNLSSNPPSVN